MNCSIIFSALYESSDKGTSGSDYAVIIFAVSIGLNRVILIHPLISQNLPL